MPVQNGSFLTKISNKKIGILIVLAQMKRIHYKNKQEQQTPRMRIMPLST
jgi:hypothetical protein